MNAPKIEVERIIPLSLIFTIIGHVVVGIALTAILFKRVSDLEQQVDRVEGNISQMESQIVQMEGINVRQEFMQQQLNRIEDKLDRFIERKILDNDHGRQ